jgi:hypothetical protein
VDENQMRNMPDTAVDRCRDLVFHRRGASVVEVVPSASPTA